MDLSKLPSTALFTAQQAVTSGTSHRGLCRAVESGALVRHGNGLYGRAGATDSMRARAEAVAMMVTRCHVVVDRTAAWLHGVDMLTLEEHELLPPVETCALRGNTPSRRAAETTARTRDLAPTDIVEMGPVRVTTPLRTAMDLSCHLRRREAFAAICLLAGAHDFGRAEMQRELTRFRGRRGVVQSRELVALVEPRVESAREAWTLLERVSSGLPRPLAQHWVEIDGVPTYRLDFAYPFARVAVEYDGREAHGGSAQQLADAERLQRLSELGWTVVVVQRGDFAPGAVDRWTREVRRALQPEYDNRRWRF